MKKHSKFRNTGILFELLVRQVTSDVLSGKERSKASDIIRGYFCEGKLLNKELQLYKALYETRVKGVSDAERLVDVVLKNRKKLSSIELAKEKFNLIKEIKEAYPLDSFLKCSLPNYKILASIYKVFEDEVAPLNECFEPQEIFRSRSFIIEYVCDNKKDTPVASNDTVMEGYREEDKDLRLLAYNLMIKSFNNKYTDLTDKQKILLREYIYNVSNTNQFDAYVKQEIPKVLIQLNAGINKIVDPALKIKLSEVYKQLEGIQKLNVIKDNHVNVMLLSYQLLEEIKNV